MKQTELFPEIALEPGSPFVGKIEEAIKKNGLMVGLQSLELNYTKTCGQLREWFPEKWETKRSYQEYFLARDKEWEDRFKNMVKVYNDTSKRIPNEPINEAI